MLDSIRILKDLSKAQLKLQWRDFKHLVKSCFENCKKLVDADQSSQKLIKISKYFESRAELANDMKSEREEQEKRSAFEL